MLVTRKEVAKIGHAWFSGRNTDQLRLKYVVSDVEEATKPSSVPGASYKEHKPSELPANLQLELARHAVAQLIRLLPRSLEMRWDAAFGPTMPLTLHVVPCGAGVTGAVLQA